MSKTKAKKRIFTGKVALVLFVIIFLLVIVAYYQYNRPNYRDLEATYNKLQIPSDWELVSKSEKKGTWGLFCWDSPSDVACPTLDISYKYVGSKDLQEKNDESIVRLVASQIGPEQITEKCSEKNEKSYCRIDIKNGELGARIMTGHDEKNNKLLNISLGSARGFGIKSDNAQTQ